MHFRNMLMPYTFESSRTTFGKFRYLGRLNVLVFMYLSFLDIRTLLDDYNIAVYTHRDFYATKFKITPIFELIILNLLLDCVYNCFQKIFGQKI